MTLVYDGSFETFLTLVYEVYYKKIDVSKIEKKIPQTLFMDDILEIDYDEQSSLKVLEALQTKFSQKHFQTILNIFMCDSVDFEISLLQFIILGFRSQKELENINQPSVFYIQNLQKELFRQNHKFTGFLRFEELEDGLLYAKVESKFNVVYFLGKHFLKRYNNQRYVIHDIKRKIAFIKDENYIGIQNISSFEIPKLSKEEEKFKKLWKTFFDSVSIESRENKKLQQQMVPLIYRVYMSEFNNN